MLVLDDDDDDEFMMGAPPTYQQSEEIGSSWGTKSAIPPLRGAWGQDGGGGGGGGARARTASLGMNNGPIPDAGMLARRLERERGALDSYSSGEGGAAAAAGGGGGGSSSSSADAKAREAGFHSRSSRGSRSSVFKSRSPHKDPIKPSNDPFVTGPASSGDGVAGGVAESSFAVKPRVRTSISTEWRRARLASEDDEIGSPRSSIDNGKPNHTNSPPASRDDDGVLRPPAAKAAAVVPHGRLQPLMTPPGGRTSGGGGVRGVPEAGVSSNLRQDQAQRISASSYKSDFENEEL